MSEPLDVFFASVLEGRGHYGDGGPAQAMNENYLTNPSSDRLVSLRALVASGVLQPGLNALSFTVRDYRYQHHELEGLMAVGDIDGDVDDQSPIAITHEVSGHLLSDGTVQDAADGERFDNLTEWCAYKDPCLLAAAGIRELPVHVVTSSSSSASSSDTDRAHLTPAQLAALVKVAQPFVRVRYRGVAISSLRAAALRARLAPLQSSILSSTSAAPGVPVEANSGSAALLVQSAAAGFSAMRQLSCSSIQTADTGSTPLHARLPLVRGESSTSEHADGIGTVRSQAYRYQAAPLSANTAASRVDAAAAAAAMGTGVHITLLVNSALSGCSSLYPGGGDDVMSALSTTAAAAAIKAEYSFGSAVPSPVAAVAGFDDSAGTGAGSTAGDSFESSWQPSLQENHERRPPSNFHSNAATIGSSGPSSLQSAFSCLASALEESYVASTALRKLTARLPSLHTWTELLVPPVMRIDAASSVSGSGSYDSGEITIDVAEEAASATHAASAANYGSSSHSSCEEAPRIPPFFADFDGTVQRYLSFLTNDDDEDGRGPQSQPSSGSSSSSSSRTCGHSTLSSGKRLGRPPKRRTGAAAGSAAAISPIDFTAPSRGCMVAAASAVAGSGEETALSFLVRAASTALGRDDDDDNGDGGGSALYEPLISPSVAASPPHPPAAGVDGRGGKQLHYVDVAQSDMPLPGSEYHESQAVNEEVAQDDVTAFDDAAEVSGGLSDAGGARSSFEELSRRRISSRGSGRGSGSKRGRGRGRGIGRGRSAQRPASRPASRSGSGSGLPWVVGSPISGATSAEIAAAALATASASRPLLALPTIASPEARSSSTAFHPAAGDESASEVSESSQSGRRRRGKGGRDVASAVGGEGLAAGARGRTRTYIDPVWESYRRKRWEYKEMLIHSASRFVPQSANAQLSAAASTGDQPSSDRDANKLSKLSAKYQSLLDILRHRLAQSTEEQAAYASNAAGSKPSSAAAETSSSLSSQESQQQQAAAQRTGQEVERWQRELRLAQADAQWVRSHPDPEWG